MTSITKIVILITAFIAISGYALEVLGDDINQPDAQVSDTPSDVKRDPPYLRRCDGIIGIFGCVTTDRSLNYPINRDYYDVMRPKDPSSPNTEFVISKHGSLRERRQVVVKTKGSDDGLNSVMSLLNRSSSSLRSKIRNRNRRSPSTPETTSNKNTTAEAHPVRNRPEKMSTTKRILISLLATLSMPYMIITPNIDYDYDKNGELITS
ncbi:uncharacterized protein LOC132937396 [Metopolophium dirhodum]|uniref:uncharacterized protein LOC132937396 n=1 Tax=Metopolophium dirhodum TaxID=44670 RepID=UPI0029901666|nr:uncharacterized protein LOC132937396 [Metopolophium dirhodum]